MTRTVDINADLGESFGPWRMGDDEALLPLVTSANVACGFHAGDPVTMIDTVRRCAELGIAVGAHPGLPDLLGFGRRAMAISPAEARAYVLYQVGALREVLRSERLELHHLKTHGALYSMVVSDDELADAVAAAFAEVAPGTLVYWPAPARDRFAEALRRHGLQVVREYYPDLDYEADGRLRVGRSIGALDPDVTRERVDAALNRNVVMTVAGNELAIEVDSICVHGDGPDAVSIARVIRDAAEAAGRAVTAPAGVGEAAA